MEVLEGTRGNRRTWGNREINGKETKNRFQLSAGLNFEKFDTNLSGTKKI